MIIDHFTKYAEAVPCNAQEMTAEATVLKILNAWFARHGTPSIMQSDNGPQFVAEVAKAFMRASQLTQAHSTAHHPATNGLVERQNKTLLNMLSVFCSRRMNDWDDHLDEVMGAYNSTRHASTGYSPHLLLTGQEKSIPLSFLYPEFGVEEFEDQSSYLKSVVQRLQEIHELVRRNMHQAQLRQKRQFDRGVRGKPFQVDELVWVFCRVIPKGGSAKLLRGWRGPYKVVEVLQEGRLYVLSSGHKVHFERLKRHISGPQEWKVLGVEEDDDEIVADPNPEDPVEEVASDVEEGSFVEEQRLVRRC